MMIVLLKLGYHKLSPLRMVLMKPSEAKDVGGQSCEQMRADSMVIASEVVDKFRPWMIIKRSRQGSTKKDGRWAKT